MTSRASEFQRVTLIIYVFSSRVESVTNIMTNMLWFFPGKWSHEYNDQHAESDASYLFHQVEPTLSECKHACEKRSKCVAIDYYKEEKECWIHTSRKDIQVLCPQNGVVHMKLLLNTGETPSKHRMWNQC